MSITGHHRSQVTGPHSKHGTSWNKPKTARSVAKGRGTSPLESFDLSLRRPTRNQWDKVATLRSSWYQQQSPEDNLNLVCNMCGYAMLGNLNNKLGDKLFMVNSMGFSMTKKIGSASQTLPSNCGCTAMLRLLDC